MIHPILPAGFNADDFNGDEMNGAGTNWPVWPVLFDTFVALDVFLVTEEMLEIFEGCADYVVSIGLKTVTFPRENRVLLLNQEGVSTIQIAAQDDTVVFSRERRAQTIDKQGVWVRIAAVSDTNVMPRETRQQPMRRRA